MPTSVPTGRCYAVLFLASFGGAWLLLAAYAFGRLSILRACLIAAVIVLFVIAAMRLQRRGKETGENAFPEAERKGNDRIFGIVNAVQWIAIFLVFLILPRGSGHSRRIVDCGLAFLCDASAIPAPCESGYWSLHSSLGYRLSTAISWQ